MNSSLAWVGLIKHHNNHGFVWLFYSREREIARERWKRTKRNTLTACLWKCSSRQMFKSLLCYKYFIIPSLQLILRENQSEMEPQCVKSSCNMSQSVGPSGRWVGGWHDRPQLYLDLLVQFNLMEALQLMLTVCVTQYAWPRQHDNIFNCSISF